MRGETLALTMDVFADLITVDWCWTATGHQLHIANRFGVTHCGRIPFLAAGPHAPADANTKVCCRCVRAAREQ